MDNYINRSTWYQKQEEEALSFIQKNRNSSKIIIIVLTILFIILEIAVVVTRNMQVGNIWIMEFVFVLVIYLLLLILLIPRLLGKKQAVLTELKQQLATVFPTPEELAIFDSEMQADHLPTNTDENVEFISTSSYLVSLITTNPLYKQIVIIEKEKVTETKVKAMIPLLSTTTVLWESSYSVLLYDESSNELGQLYASSKPAYEKLIEFLKEQLPNLVKVEELPAPNKR